MIVELAGFIQAVAFVICGMPQAYDSWKYKTSHGINKYFLLSWLIGEVAMLIYVQGDFYISLQASINIICILIIGRYM